MNAKPLSRRVGRLALAFALSLMVPAGLFAQEQEPTTEQNGQKVDETRSTLEEWVDLRRTISKEKRDWALGREMLTDRVDIVKREIDSLQQRIADAEKSIGDADQKKADLADKNQRLKDAAARLQTVVTTYEQRTKELLKRLPDPIRDRVRQLSQRLPEDPEKTGMSLSERFMNVVGILNAIDKFHREITVTSEVRTLGDGSTAEVTAMYVGISQGYYVTAKGDAAGMGSSGEEGWVWSPANEHAAEIQRAIRIMKNEEPADFVRLPVRIK